MMLPGGQSYLAWIILWLFIIRVKQAIFSISAFVHQDHFVSYAGYIFVYVIVTIVWIILNQI